MFRAHAVTDVAASSILAESTVAGLYFIGRAAVRWSPFFARISLRAACAGVDTWLAAPPSFGAALCLAATLNVRVFRVLSVLATF